jgi:hypothetical protein
MTVFDGWQDWELSEFGCQARCVHLSGCGKYIILARNAEGHI